MLLCCARFAKLLKHACGERHDRHVDENAEVPDIIFNPMRFTRL